MSKRLAKKVLLIGWDGADWQVIRPLIEQGKMPNLQALIERGVSGNLATIQPVLSPMLWNSIATGKRADKHGIHGFLEPMPDRSGIRPVTSTTRKCKAVWNMLSQSEMTSQVVSWFASHPAEPIKGSIVSDRYVGQTIVKDDQLNCPDRTFHPEGLAEELAPLIVGVDAIKADALSMFVNTPEKIDQKTDDKLVRLASLIARTSTVQAAGCKLLSNQDWDFTALYFIGIDEFGHTFMPYHPPQLEGIDDKDFSIYGTVMENCYRFHDMMLGAQLQLVGSDTTVVLVSDHGFKNDTLRPGIDGMDDPAGWHRHHGIACLAGPGIQQGESLRGATVLDITPTILTLLGLPVGEDMDGRPWLEVLSAQDEIERIPSWEEIEGKSGMHPEEVREDPLASAEAIKHLVDLGYIESPSDDVEQAISDCILDQRENLIQALLASRRASEAIPLLRELVAENPDQHRYHLRLAQLLFIKEEYEECERAISKLPDEALVAVDVKFLVAQLAHAQNDVRRAAAIIKEILQSNLSIEMTNLVGCFLIELKQWKAARVLLQETLSTYEENPVALNGLSTIHNEHERFEEAAEFAMEAITLQPYFPEAHFQLGVALRGLGQEQEAITAFETSLSFANQEVETHTQLASLYRISNPSLSAKHAQLAGMPLN